MATNYDINYDDKRFQQVESEKKTELNKTTNTYNEMINSSNSYYQQQIDASKQWADKQSEIQQANTDFTIEKVNQAKDQAKKDYTKEQKGAYTDYQKAINPYGANAEKLAEQGLSNTGYAESTRTSMYNTYQNRYMAARESYNQAILNYDNSIKEAQLANNAQLAQIAYEALQKQLELSLQGFQYKNQLILQKTEALNAVNDRYYNRYQDVLKQINTENALAEQVRQYNEKMAEEKRQYNETMAFQKQKAAQEQANWEKEYALAKSKAYSSSSSGSSSSKKGTVKDTSTSNSSSSKGTVSSSTNKTNTSNSSTMSRNATRLYNNLSAMARATGQNKILSATRQDTEFSIVSNARANNSISRSEAETILKKLGH